MKTARFPHEKQHLKKLEGAAPLAKAAPRPLLSLSLASRLQHAPFDKHLL